MFVLVIAVAFVLAPVLALALLPLYVVADRLQPAALRPAKVVRDRIWLRGVGTSVLGRFPERASPEG